MDDKDKTIAVLAEQLKAMTHKVGDLKQKLAATNFPGEITGSFAHETETKSGNKKTLRVELRVQRNKLIAIIVSAATGGAAIWHAFLNYFHR